MMLLTNKSVDSNNSVNVWKIIEIYLTRWKCEEVFGRLACKELYINKRYSSHSVSHSLFYFYLHRENKKLQMVLEKIFFLSKRFFGIPDFYNYAIAKGIYNALYNNKVEINYLRKEPKN